MVFMLFLDDIGLFPNILNLATRSTISVNATCGEEKSEVFCKLVDHVKIFPYKNSHCDICDARSRDERQRHPITNAINGRNSWWQSPTLTNGAKYNYVTITLDLKQVWLDPISFAVLVKSYCIHTLSLYEYNIHELLHLDCKV